MHLFVGLENVACKFPYFIVNWIDTDIKVSGLSVKLRAEKNNVKGLGFQATKNALPDMCTTCFIPRYQKQKQLIMWRPKQAL